jgi:hypothetical protein
MNSHIFTEEERQILEAYLISQKVDQTKLDTILNQIKTQKQLFDDIFLYLQIKKQTPQ